ncbi:uncharacterized protein LOC142592696 isoform X1 [Dermacentor variabilis]|uniref:uncharacterized protein LOC142592696 isoform X1 n=1 Tax=Dermacentor variabilis TaxID=34621 RepID=UPI003F5B347F
MKLIKRAHRQERSLAKHLEKNKDVPESLNKGTRDRRQELAGGCQDVLNFQGAQVVQVAAAASPEEDDEEQISTKPSQNKPTHERPPSGRECPGTKRQPRCFRPPRYPAVGHRVLVIPEPPES